MHCNAANPSSDRMLESKHHASVRIYGNVEEGGYSGTGEERGYLLLLCVCV